MTLTDRNSLIGRCYEHISEHGLGSFLITAPNFLLPEPHRTRVKGHREVVMDLILNGNHSPLSPAESLRACWHGFKQEYYVQYGLHNGEDPANYLNEVSRRHAKLTNHQPALLDDKLRFYRYLTDLGFGEFVPTVYGQIEKGVFVGDRYDSITELVEDQGSVIIKSRDGGGGHDVYVCRSEDGTLTLRARSGKAHSLNSKRTEFRNHIVTEYCHQAPYIDRIYPAAANTIRALTLRTDDGIVLPAAVHRIGTHRSGVLDNFSQNGLSASIDPESGELSAAAERIPARGLRWHETHPDTGHRIAGATVPGWQQIRDELRRVAAEATPLNYVGWDLIVTEPGEFTIIEGNSHPNPRLIQIHDPLLAEESVRRFFETRGVLSSG